jgi:hypothetical protein
VGIWDDNAFKNLSFSDTVKPFLRGLVELFAVSQTGRPYHKVEVLLGSERGKIAELGMRTFVDNSSQIYYPGFNSLYFVQPNLRSELEGYTVQVLRAWYRLYAASGVGPYSLKQVYKQVWSDSKRDIEGREIVIGTFLAQGFRDFLYRRSGSPEDWPGIPEWQMKPALPNMEVMLQPTILDFANLPEAWLRQKKLGLSGPDNPPTISEAQKNKSWDVFISHASEDKDLFVKPLANALQSRGLRVWYDEFELKLGDSLRQSIDRGLRDARFGIVVLSHAFFKKDWPQKELDGLTAREVDGRRVILPIWHNLSKEDVLAYSPMLADRVASLSSKGIEAVVRDVLNAIG